MQKFYYFTLTEQLKKAREINIKTFKHGQQHDHHVLL